ncbi:MAG: WD40/YVTN/BNR-like repeat-containing protein [Arenimonas sp.]
MPKPSERGACLTGALLLSLSLASSAQAPTAPPSDPSELTAELLPRAAQSLLLDAVHASSGYYVSGERGHVLTSTDGAKWQQQQVPTRSTLTALATVDGQLWAAGHDGVILHSADGGQTWHPQRRDPYLLAPDQDTASRDQRQGAPLLDILFTDAAHGIAVGAYSLMLQTTDGGGTWTTVQALSGDAGEPATPQAVASESGVFNAEDLELGEESNPHFNAIARTSTGALAVVGERGTFLRSRDEGATWQKLPFPYAGSLFGVLAWEDDHILAYGLRGNVYESTDLGSTWTKLDSVARINLMGGTALANGGAVLVGSNGVVLTRPDGASPFVAGTYSNAAGETPALAAVIPADAGFVVVGEKGVDTYQPKK